MSFGHEYMMHVSTTQSLQSITVYDFEKYRRLMRYMYFLWCEFNDRIGKNIKSKVLIILCIN